MVAYLLPALGWVCSVLGSTLRENGKTAVHDKKPYFFYHNFPWQSLACIWARTEDNNIRIRDLCVDLTVPKVLEEHIGWVWSVAFSSNGKGIVSGSGDASIRIWDVMSGTSIGNSFRGHDDWVTLVSFSADDAKIILGSWDGTVRILNTEKGEQIGELPQYRSNKVYSVGRGSIGTILAVGPGWWLAHR